MKPKTKKEYKKDVTVEITIGGDAMERIRLHKVEKGKYDKFVDEFWDLCDKYFPPPK